MLETSAVNCFCWLWLLHLCRLHLIKPSVWIVWQYTVFSGAAFVYFAVVFPFSLSMEGWYGNIRAFAVACSRDKHYFESAITMLLGQTLLKLSCTKCRPRRLWSADRAHGPHGLHSMQGQHSLHRPHGLHSPHSPHGQHSPHSQHGLHRLQDLHSLHGLQGLHSLQDLHSLHRLQDLHSLQGLHSLHGLQDLHSL